VFQDDYTGTSLNRPALRALRVLVQSRAIQGLIVYDIDRLSRKLAHQLLLTEELEHQGVKLHVVTMPTTGVSPENQLLGNVRGIIAEYERAKILERTARGRRGRAQAGYVNGGKRTLGYTYVKHESKGASYAIDPEEAALVQRIFRLYVQEGKSLYAIAQQLTQDRIPTPGDRGISGPKRALAPCLWHPASLLAILRNETYTGRMYYGKTERLPGKANPDKKTRWRKRPKEEWTAIPVPPIIDQTTFDAAQAQRVRNAQHSRRNRKREYLLCNARLRCGICGRVMTGQYNPARQYRFYRCNGRSYLAGHPCKARVNATQVEAQVWAAVERVLSNPALIAEEVERQRHGTSAQHDALERDRQRFAGQLAQCDKELKKWELAYVHDAIDVQDFKAKTAEVLTRRTSIDQELTQIAAQQAQLREMELETTALTAYCRRVRAELTRFDLEDKRLALSALQLTATWYPDKPLEIQGSIPVDGARDVDSNAPRST
jgi:site-specific DNA recombinase